MTDKKPARTGIHDSVCLVTVNDGLDISTNSARPMTMTGGGEGAFVRPATTGEGGAGARPPKPTK